MDIAQQGREDMKMPSPRIAGDSSTKTDIVHQTKPSVKRSFDVAFLMLPDEKLKNKQLEKVQRLNSDAIVTYPSQISVKSDESLREMSERRIEQFNGHHKHFTIHPNFMQMNNNTSIINNNNTNNNNELLKNGRFFIQNGTPSPRMYDDPTIVSHELMNRMQDIPKSAFTKVPHSRQESPIPPPPLSPEQLSCPSTSPPISTSPPRNIIYQNFRPEYQFMNGSRFHTITQMQQLAQSQKFKQQFAYRPIQIQQHPDLPTTTSYLPTGTFPFAGGHSHPFAQQSDLTGIVRNPAAAALLTTLIPPTIATSFSLTAQNVCAKCNISFRMTSDLVYHMRSHHKSELTTDTYRRKREEKLKCPVCNESFRERHHLTRHMTAHQDKASDETENIQIQRRHK